MSKIIIDNNSNFKFKDISKDGVIKNPNDSNGSIDIRLDSDKYKQNKIFASDEDNRFGNYKKEIVDDKAALSQEHHIGSQKKSNIKNTLGNANSETTSSLTSSSSSNNGGTSKSNSSDSQKKKAKTKSVWSSSMNSKSNRHYISSKVLSSGEQMIDSLASESDDLGIDAIIKTKIALKASNKVLKKGTTISKQVGGKVYKVATSEETKRNIEYSIRRSKALQRYTRIKINHAIADRKKTQNSKDKVIKDATEVKSQMIKGKQAKDAKIIAKENSLKKLQKQEIAKKARKKLKEEAENIFIALVAKLKGAVETLFSSNIALIVLVILVMVLTIMSLVVSITSVFAYSANLAVDDNVTMITEYITKLDTDINSQIEFAEENYPGIDRFVYNVPEKANTNQDQVYAYLKALYGDEKVDDAIIKATIDQIHGKLYNLTFDKTSHSHTVKHEDGTVSHYTTYTLTITLTTKSFEDYYEENKDSLLTENQQKDYENILKLMKENVGKRLSNPFPGVDWRNYVTSRYGYRVSPTSNSVEKHTGLDIGMVEGTTIHATMSGTVHTYNLGDSSYGLYLTITNGIYETLYGHCSELLVEDGQTVNVGDEIAKVGSTGRSTGPHLHLEYKIDGVGKNPESYLKIYKSED